MLSATPEPSASPTVASSPTPDATKAANLKVAVDHLGAANSFMTAKNYAAALKEYHEVLDTAPPESSVWANALSGRENARTAMAALTPVPTAITCQAQSGDFCVTDIGYEQGYVGYVVGSVTNRGTRAYLEVMITIALRDSAGNRTGSTFASIADLAAGETWKFRAPVFQPQPDGHYEVSGISGF